MSGILGNALTGGVPGAVSAVAQFAGKILDRAIPDAAAPRTRSPNILTCNVGRHIRLRPAARPRIVSASPPCTPLSPTPAPLSTPTRRGNPPLAQTVLQLTRAIV